MKRSECRVGDTPAPCPRSSARGAWTCARDAGPAVPTLASTDGVAVYSMHPSATSIELPMPGIALLMKSPCAIGCWSASA